MIRVRETFPSNLPKAPLYQWAALQSELIWIYEGPLDASTLDARSDHRTDYRMWLIQAGCVQVKVGGKAWKAQAGDWMLCPRGGMHQKFSPGARILSVHFKSAWPTGENLFEGDNALVFKSRRFPRLKQRAFSLVKLARRHFPRVQLDFSLQETSYQAHLRFQSHFLQWMAAFASVMLVQNQSFTRVGSADERAFRSAKILHQTSQQAEFPTAQLQADAGLGRAQLDRLFWSSFGLTTRKYWDKLKVNAAVRKLESSALPLKEISYSLGFKQPSYFTQWFKQRRGASPKAFRKGINRRRKDG